VVSPAPASVLVARRAKPLARPLQHRLHGTPRPMPVGAPLVDRYGRAQADPRVSVIDQCNLRCVYCMPEEDRPFLPRAEILSLEEVARVARSVGITSLRLTGASCLSARRSSI